MSSAVVVGGLGFVGRYLVRVLSGLGWRVVVTSRRRRGVGSGLFDGLEGVSVRFGVGGPRDLVWEGGGPSVVYYLPGSPGGLRAGGVWSANFGVARLWGEWAAGRGSLFVYVSSIGVTADFSFEFDEEGRIVEESVHLSGRDPSRASSVHSESKAALERLLVSGGLGRRLGGRYVIVRPGLIYGGGNPHLEWRLLSLLSRLRVRPYSRVIPVVSVECVARFLAGPVLDGELLGRWVNLVEARDFGSVLDGLFGECRGACLRFSVDGLARLLGRLSPRRCKGRLAYSIVSRGRPYWSRLVGSACGGV